MKKFNENTMFRVGLGKSIPFKHIKELSVQAMGIERTYQVTAKSEGGTHTLFTTTVVEEAYKFFDKLHDMIGDYITVDDIESSLKEDNEDIDTLEDVKPKASRRGKKKPKTEEAEEEV